MTAKHIQSLGPSSRCHPEKKNTSCWSEPASRASLYTMILKSQIKTTKAVTAWFRTSTPHPPQVPFPSTKPLLELVHRIIKIWSEAESTALPSGISAKRKKGKKKMDRKKSQKSVLFSQMSKDNPTPPGEMKSVTNKGRKRETSGEKGDVPDRGSCGYT